MKGPVLILSAVVLMIGGLALSGCATLVGTAGHSSAAAPSAKPSAAEAGTDLPVKANAFTSQIEPIANERYTTTCTTPAGWVPYQLQTNETIFSIAARTAVTVADVLSGNCLTSVAQVKAGSWLAVPPAALTTLPQTILPLGISAFVANPVQANGNLVDAGSPVTLLWQAQGPVVTVRIGWLYQGQFIEEVGNLSASGAWTLAAPDDGRSQITYMVRVSDGLREVAAQTTIQIACAEGWFFAPAPTECASPPVTTTFHAQSFERGTIVYIPALRIHYVLIQGMPGRQVIDPFVPGMPLRDPALDGTIPAGLDQPRGAIHYAWRSDDTIMTGLGYASGPVRIYTGLLQRTAGASSGETVYFSSSVGTIYRFTEGQMWRVLIAQ